MVCFERLAPTNSSQSGIFLHRKTVSKGPKSNVNESLSCGQLGWAIAIFLNFTRICMIDTSLYIISDTREVFVCDVNWLIEALICQIVFLFKSSYCSLIVQVNQRKLFFCERSKLWFVWMMLNLQKKLLMSRRLFTFREERSWEAFRSSRRDREAFGDNNNASSPKHRERRWNKMVQVTLIHKEYHIQYFKEIVSWTKNK